MRKARYKHNELRPKRSESRDDKMKKITEVELRLFDKDELIEIILEKQALLDRCEVVISDSLELLIRVQKGIK